MFIRIVSLTILLLPAGALAQTDSTENAGPTICDCAKHAKDDPQLLSQCEQKYDYNLMSDYEREQFEEKISACDDPEVCDCINRSAKDAYLKKSCDKKFNPDTMTEKELESYNRDKDRCYVKPEKPSLKLICECVNGDLEKDGLDDKCKDVWNLSNLTKEERMLFVEEVTACIENKDDPDFTLTLCDCLDAGEEEYELMERCVNKFDLNEMSDSTLTDLKDKLDDCDLDLTYGDDVSLACDCFKESPQVEEMSSKCQALLKRLEQKFMNASPTEREAFVQKLMECLTDSMN